MGQGHQKADHSGNFYMMPRRVVSSVAWRHCSFRARCILDAFMLAFNGRNNGEIVFAIHDIGAALGNQGHSANARAVAELIEKGFLQQTSDANRAQSKARTYRITFVTTGSPRAIEPATHDYEDWQPVKKRKFGGARTASKNPVSGAVTASTVKTCLAETASDLTESRGFEGHPVGANTAPLLYNHPTGSEDRPEKSPDHLQYRPEIFGADFRTDIADLREWARQVTQQIGYGGNRTLADDAGIPEVALSRFRNGKNLPDQYRIPLQEACGRHIPFSKLAA